MNGIAISELTDIILETGKLELPDGQFERFFEFNTAKSPKSRLSLKLKRGQTLTNEPKENKRPKATVRIWTEQPDQHGFITQVAVIGSDLFDRLSNDLGVGNIFVPKTDGAGYGNDGVSILKSIGQIPNKPMFVDEPRLATVLWLGGQDVERSLPDSVRQFFSGYFRLVKDWI